MKKLKLRFKQCKVLGKYALAKLLSYLLKGQNKYNNLWFITERGTDARDNAFFFYLYLKEKHPGINAVYCITEGSADSPKVEGIGTVVRHGSWKHLILLNLAKYVISTHNCGFLYERNLFSHNLKEKLVNSFGAKIIFLQHGITQNYLNDLVYPNAQVDLFICGAKTEYEYVSKLFKHPSEVITYTGFARFDNLHDMNVKKQILLMPTWRLNLNNLTMEEYSQSQYFEKFSRILNSKEIIRLLEENNYELVFYPHYEVQKFIKLYKTESELIKIADFENYDVQELLKESALLITDYSSVFFDFAYMKKPIIYYQFDRKDFFLYQYRKGYFDYDTMGFGNVAFTESELFHTLAIALSNNCKLELEYEKRIEKFFPVYDNKNCERIFNKIIEL